MPYEFARLLYDESATGITVVVSSEKEFPSTVAHPGLFAPIDVKGAPAAEPGSRGDFAWQPEASTEGPMTILVTGQDRRIRVFRGGVQIGWSIYALDDPARTLSFHVLTLLQEMPSYPGAGWSSGPSARWMIVSGAPETTVSADELLLGVHVPAEFLDKLRGSLATGTTMVLTQLPASGDTTGLGMTVVTAEEPAKR
jgi:hypothetical protein